MSRPAVSGHLTVLQDAGLIAHTARRFRDVALAAMAAAVLLAAPAGAEVLDASATAFTVRATVTLAKDAGAVYDAFTQHVGEWWDESHTYSGRSSNLSLAARAGGCFCEQLAAGGVEHMTVVYAERGKTLRMRGGLGPLQALTVTGIWTVTLEEQNGKTTLVSTYSVGGYTKDGLAALAPLVDGVMTEQMTRFKRFSER